MRPIKIEFQAFGPYVGHEVVDFEKLSSKGLFLICGKTGIGKTMILDAMTFALFGKSSGHGRDNFEAMRCTNAPFETSTFVRFEFENNGEYYRFERRLERKRKNLSASYDVSRKDDDGVWRTMMENAKEKDVNSKAEEIIGLQYDQFRQVIVLPQGQFEKLLTSKSEEKEVILTSIFGEEKWEKIAEKFYKNAIEKSNELTKVKEMIYNSLKEEDCETISDLEQVINGKKRELETLETEYNENNYDKVIKEQQDNLRLVGRFADLHKAKSKLSDLENQKDYYDKRKHQLEDAKRADKVKNDIDNVNRLITELEKRKEEETKAKGEAQKKETTEEDAKKRLNEHKEQSKDIEILKARKIDYENKRDAYSQIGSIEQEIKNLNKKIADASNEEEKTKEFNNQLITSINDLGDQYLKLSNEHLELVKNYIAGITGKLAEELEDGKPCPVCGSTEHPNKACAADNSVTKEMVDEKKEEADNKKEELDGVTEQQKEADKDYQNKKEETSKLKEELALQNGSYQNAKKNLVEGIQSLDDLEQEIERIKTIVDNYDGQTQALEKAKQTATKELTEAKSKASTAIDETKKAKEAYDNASKQLEENLKENGFESKEEAEALVMEPNTREKISTEIYDYNADLKNTQNNINDYNDELKGKSEPDKEVCQEILNEANDSKERYIEQKSILDNEIKRLNTKFEDLKNRGEGIEEKIREAEQDSKFAKQLNGNTGTGLQRYVLGILFSSVVAAANKMLDMVHGGRYRLYRSDEKADGSNKKGLELKVFDSHSEEHDGRFVSTLSGGEKFLTSLALSIGMSTVAQKSGIKIEALFIDEGFGSLDEESIGDAMNILNSIQEANGLVGIISHVQLLQDQIPSKLYVKRYDNSSHIEQTIG